MATTRLTRTLGTPTNRKKLTASMWLKKSFNGAEKHFFGTGASGGYLDFRFASSDELELYHYNSGYQFRLTTTRKYRDNNAWYHLVFTIDTSLATADDRFKVYVNGVQETIFTNRTNPSLNYDIGSNVSGNTISVGNYGTNTGNSFDGIMSHVIYCDGYSYGPEQFGETDSTTGEWKFKTPSGISYGTNGFWWLKDDIATTDHSPNSNTFTVASGNLTKTEESPSNIFATWNNLWSQSNGNVGDVTFSNGNTTTTTTTSYRTTPASLGMFGSGKYYWEIKRIEDDGADFHAGVMSEDATPANTATWIGNAANGWVVSGDGGEPYTGGTGGSAGARNGTRYTATVVQGNNGGSNGGGGAGAAGGNNGGSGLTSSITGTAVTRAGGGGKGCDVNGGGVSGGGSGGGGRGAESNGNGTNGAANTGSGGGGGRDYIFGQGAVGSGGSGIVILKYPSGFSLTDVNNSLADNTTDLGNGYKVTTITGGTGYVKWTV